MAVLDSMAFLDNGQSVVHGVRRALAEVLASVGGDPSQPQEISRRFGLDKTLTWRIARVIREEDAWEAVPHIPRRPSIRIFVKRMAQHGATQEQLDSVWRAVDDFERFVETHSGDRETLEAMVSGTARRSAEKRMEAFRKSGFQANSAVWGIRARLQFSLNIMTPAAQPDMLDIATVCGFSDLLRLRANVPWAVASAIAWDTPDGAAADGGSVPLPLHPDGLFDGVPVIPQFCSDPPPALRTVRAVGGNSRFEITGGPVGNTAAATVVLGWRWPTGVSIFQGSPGEMGEHGAHLSTPVEMAVVDLLIHRTLTFAMQPVARVYSELPGGPRYPTEGHDTGLLPLPDDVVDLGTSPPETTTPELPRYREIVEFAAQCMGCSINDFRGFRYRLRYPPIPTLALLQHQLLARSDD